MLASLKILNLKDMEHSYGQTAINIMENGKMAKVMETGLRYGKMEENI